MDFTSKGKTRAVLTSFTIDGESYTAREPKNATLMDVFANADQDDPLATVRATLAFLDDAFVAESRDRIRARLRDPDDPLDLADLEPIFEWLLSEWSARPTQPPSASSRRRAPTGTTSTARSRSTASTRKTSR